MAGRAPRPLDHRDPRPGSQQIEKLEAAGAQRIMFQDFLPFDLDMVTVLGRIAAA